MRQGCCLFTDYGSPQGAHQLLSILWYDSLSQNLLKYICLPANEAAFVKRQEYL
ncbi:hypothetical protein Plhal304r1_c037g0112131 [Plasmopara halstedii]